jgi:hypothetical protein
MFKVQRSPLHGRKIKSLLSIKPGLVPGRLYLMYILHDHIIIIEYDLVAVFALCAKRCKLSGAGNNLKCLLTIWSLADERIRVAEGFDSIFMVDIIVFNQKEPGSIG